jgi:H+/Cl- antiporter ClcA
MPLIASKLRKAAGVAFVATVVLAFVGLIVANSVGDQVPPYEPSTINTLAWNCFLVCGAVAAALGVLHFVWLIRDDNRR